MRKTDMGTERQKRERKTLLDKLNSLSLLIPSTAAEIWSTVKYTSIQHSYAFQIQALKKKEV